MKIFLDSTDTAEVKELFKTNLINGVTTNPSLIAKSGRQPDDIYSELQDIGIPDISMEVVGSYDVMLEEALRLKDKFGDCCTIKLPMSEEGLLLCEYLDRQHMDIRTNVTTIFTAAQALLAARCGANYISPFIGRLDDQQVPGLEVVRIIQNMLCAQNLKGGTRVVAASIRDVRSVISCAVAGVPIVTVPPKVFRDMYKSQLTDAALAQFDQAFSAYSN
ncbi:MAG: fructose-6-phosphate aldolase [Euryarchaeota archaeon]|nr:fructose-6-phosphate aldolase [Euryarchaeota archaeon]